MGITKTNLYTEEHNEQAELFKALGHPARLKIVIHLLRVKSCICGDIVDEVKLSQPAITRHLKVLKDANVIQGNIEGNKVCYCINADSFRALKGIISLMEVEALGINGGCC
jgi:DNA-binding transcriptional ArsR family regulator